jgi:transcriptional regulator GlxA family with amidase domain
MSDAVLTAPREEAVLLAAVLAPGDADPLAGASLAVSPKIRAALDFLEERFAEPLSLAHLARLSKLSPCRFSTVFRREVGMSPQRYLCRLRVRAAQHLLRQGETPAVAAIEAGFFDQSHLNRHFKRICGATPARFAAAAR